jgi:DNA-binding Lrp family transcriptional regulator
LKKGLTKKIDDVDLQIINLLQEDSRSSFRNIAGELKIAPGTVYNHIKRLEDREVLKSYTIVVDPTKMGYDLTVLILVEAEGKHLPDVENEIAKISNVISVYDITGDFDIAVVARFMDRSGLNVFIKNLLKIPYIKKTVSNVALNVIKEDFRIRIF